MKVFDFLSETNFALSQYSRGRLTHAIFALEALVGAEMVDSELVEPLMEELRTKGESFELSCEAAKVWRKIVRANPRSRSRPYLQAKAAMEACEPASSRLGGLVDEWAASERASSRVRSPVLVVDV